jgi:hypothetical protein
MLLAVFPANINVAVNNLQLQLFPTDAAAQWIRLLFQPVLIGLVLWVTEAEPESARKHSLWPRASHAPNGRTRLPPPGLLSGSR